MNHCKCKPVPSPIDAVEAARLKMQEAEKVLREVARDLTSRRKFYPEITLNDAAVSYAETRDTWQRAFNAWRKAGL